MFGFCALTIVVFLWAADLADRLGQRNRMHFARARKSGYHRCNCDSCGYPNIEVVRHTPDGSWYCAVCRRIPLDNPINAIAWGVNHILATLEARLRTKV